MKTILTMCLVMMISLASQSTNNKPTTSKGGKFLIEGNFLGEKNVECTLYKLDAAGNFIQQGKEKFKKNFGISCEIGSNYIIQFTSENSNTKLLLVEATVAGKYIMDVEFSSIYNAAIKFKGHGYSLCPIDKEESKTLFVQK